MLNIHYMCNLEYTSSFEILLFNNYLKKEYIFTYTHHQKYKRTNEKQIQMLIECVTQISALIVKIVTMSLMSSIKPMHHDSIENTMYKCYILL